MRKSQKLLSLCLGLVLSLGVSACDDLPSSLDDGGGDEETASEELEDESEGPIEPVVSYQVEITNEGPISLEVGQSVTIDLAFYSLIDDVRQNEEGTAVLSSSEEGIVSIDGYTVTALSAGETIITASWIEHDATSEGITISVTEPIVTPTTEYSIAITSPASGTNILTNTATPIGVSLTTIIDGTQKVEEGSAQTVKLNVSPDTSVTVEGLTITGTASETVTITATWIAQDITSEPISITFVEPSVDPEITYGATITNPTTETVLYVGSSLTVSATLYTYSDGAVSATDSATADNVTLTLDESSTDLVTISGLSVTGVSAGSVTLIVTWGEYASASVTFTVKSVYTYAVEISNPTASTTLDVGQTLEVSASLLSYTDGALTNSETATGSNVTVTQTSGSGSITTSGLTVTGVSAGTVTLTVTWGEYASADVTFEVKSVYTYKVTITSPVSGYELEVDSTIDATISLYTIIDDVEATPETANATDISWSQSGTGSVSFDGLTIKGVSAGDVTITATWTEHSVSDSVTFKVVEAEPVFESYTYIITFYNSSNESLGALPEGMELYAAGSFNGSGEIQSDNDGNEWYEWGTEYVKLTDNSDGTFNLVLDILPRANLDINIYAHDTSVDDPNTDMWDYYVAYHLISDDDLTNATGTSDLTYSLSLWTTEYSSWDEIFSSDEPGDNPGVEPITVTTYICVVDSTGNGWVNDGTFHNENNIFVNNEDTYHNWDKSTWIQAYVGNSARNAYYQSSTLELESGSTYWVNFAGPYSNQEYYFEMTIPSNYGNIATFVVYIDMTAFEQWEEGKESATSGFDTQATGTWYSGAVGDVVGSGGQLS